jgi:hypothetical protein
MEKRGKSDVPRCVSRAGFINLSDVSAFGDLRHQSIRPSVAFLISVPISPRDLDALIGK